MKLNVLTNKDVQKALSTLQKERVPSKVAFMIKKITEIVANEDKDFHAVRMDLVTRYATKKEDGVSVAFDTNGNATFIRENFELFIKAYQELLDIDVPVPYSVSFADLPTDVTTSAADLALLGEAGIIDFGDEQLPALTDKSSISTPDAVPATTAQYPIANPAADPSATAPAATAPAATDGTTAETTPASSDDANVASTDQAAS